MVYCLDASILMYYVHVQYVHIMYIVYCAWFPSINPNPLEAYSLAYNLNPSKSSTFKTICALCLDHSKTSRDTFV